MSDTADTLRLHRATRRMLARDDVDETPEPRAYSVAPPSMPLAIARSPPPLPPPARPGVVGRDPAPSPRAARWRALLASEAPQRYVDAANDALHVSMNTLRIFQGTGVSAQSVETLLMAMRHAQHVLRESKPIVDAATGKALDASVRQKFTALVVHRFWGDAFSPVKALALRLLFEALLVRLTGSIAHCKTVLLTFDICKRLEPYLFGTEQLKQTDLQSRLKGVVLRGTASLTWEDVVRNARQALSTIRAILADPEERIVAAAREALDAVVHQVRQPLERVVQCFPKHLDDVDVLRILTALRSTRPLPPPT